MARLRSVTATSAGGIVSRRDRGRLEIVVGRRRRDRDIVTWTLPKGTPDPGETTEQTALREVREETGLEVRITAPFDSIHYTFVQGGTRIHKTVHYFLMEPTGGDLGRHDREFDDVRWIGLHDATGMLTFPTERALVDRAIRALEPAAAAAEASPERADPGPAEPRMADSRLPDAST